MPTTLIRGGLVHDAVHRDACKADILLADGKIAAIGTDLTAPADAAVFDADGLEVYPGFVDAHTHIGLDGYGIGYEGCDYNEMNDIWTPQLRAIDGVGELRLMLTVDSGTKRELAQDTTAERSGSEDMKRKSETVVVGTGSGTQEVVVTNRVYPRYVGALVVCEGGGSAGVRLAVTQAVSALTALPSDKITVLQGKP